IALLEFGKLPLDFGGLSLRLELADILEPFFRRALLGFGTRAAARGGADDARALERRCRLPKSVSVPNQSSPRRPRGLPGSIRRERLLVRARARARERSRSRRSRPCLFLARSFGRARDIRREAGLLRSGAHILSSARARARLLPISPRFGL